MVVVGFDAVVVVDVCHEDGDGDGMSEEQHFRAYSMALSRRPYCPLEWRKHIIPSQSESLMRRFLITEVCYTAQQTVQILDGIRDSFLLASYAISKSDQLVDPIFAKYFDVDDRSVVMGKLFLQALSYHHEKMI